MTLLLDLPDEVLVSIGKWVSCFTLKDFAHFRSTNRRLHSLLSQPEVLSSLLDSRNVATLYRPSITTLARLHLYEIVQSCGLFDENRVGFDYGSPHVIEDDFEDEDDEVNVKGSQSRLDAIQTALRQHNRRLVVTVDSHSGLGAPSLELAENMSRARGMGICDGWFREFAADPDTPNQPTGVVACPWSLQAAEAALNLSHPNGGLARTGKGWAELRLSFKGDIENDFMLPPRPGYYQGLEPLAIPDGWLDYDASDQEEEGDSDDDNAVPFFGMYIQMDDSSDEGDDEEINSEEDNTSSDDDERSMDDMADME